MVLCERVGLRPQAFKAPAGAAEAVAEAALQVAWSSSSGTVFLGAGVLGPHVQCIPVLVFAAAEAWRQCLRSPRGAIGIGIVRVTVVTAGRHHLPFVEAWEGSISAVCQDASRSL
ncbi:UNVERIFIED_CONTAM: hypothetical protein FKN15_022012 [Acipenser sinensis]